MTVQIRFFPAVLLSLAACVGCSSKFVVKSEPLQADVFVVDGKGTKKPLGKTPLEMPAEEVRKAMDDAPTTGEFYTVTVEKQGFDTQTFNIPVSKFTTMVTALDVKLSEGVTQKELRLAKEILDHLFLAQKFALSSQFERAQIEIDKILTPFPTFSRALSMKASIYFAQKNYRESLKYYEEALKNDPDLDEAVRMTAKVRGLLGLPPRAAASTNDGKATK